MNPKINVTKQTFGIRTMPRNKYNRLKINVNIANNANYTNNNVKCMKN